MSKSGKNWSELPAVLTRLDVTHLRILAELQEPVIPKLRMLTGWGPQVMSDQIVKLAATSVLNEKLAGRERSHTRTLQWIALLGPIIGAIAGFLLGAWLV